MYIRIIQDLGTGSTEGPKLQVFYVIDAPDGLYGAFENHKEAEEHLSSYPGGNIRQVMMTWSHTEYESDAAAQR